MSHQHHHKPKQLIPEKYNKVLFTALFIGTFFLSPAIALFLGILYALTIQNPYGKLSKKVSKYMLQFSVVGLGFGMNLHESMKAGADGMMFTIVSVIGVMIIGILVGKWMLLKRKTTYLISAGTAICGGSAIAAVAPVVNADDDETTVALATIFTLNAIALFIFPPIGHLLDMSQHEFGLWSAIAIHDTSSVVGAAASYGQEALITATTVKLTRALWIIPMAIVSMFLFKSKDKKISIPWFIFLFIAAMIVNTYVELPELFSKGMKMVSHASLSATLFLIGGGLSLHAIRNVGARPLILGVILWIIISITSLVVILF